MKNHLTDNLIAQLNGIYHLSAMGNEVRAREQIKVLAETLRYKIRNRNELVSLRMELDMVLGFFSLFSARWGDEFQYTLNTPESLLDEYIPHYSIMDLVENALFHAFETQEGERTVQVSAFRGEGGLTISVEDNGCGFISSIENTDSDRANELANDHANGDGGLISLRTRLMTLYGEKARLSFFPFSDSGTRAELFIPDMEPPEGST